MNNMAFAYTLTPLEMAESMAFNLDCLGCICWFEYGKIVAMPGRNEAVSPELQPYVRFFHKRRDLLARRRGGGRRGRAAELSLAGLRRPEVLRPDRPGSKTR